MGVGSATGSAKLSGSGRRLRHEDVLALALSIGLTFVFFYPALIDGTLNAGWLYSGDVAGFYTPSILKTQELVHGLHLTALDYSLYGGSSDFYVAPNFFPFHPLLVLFGLLVPPSAGSVAMAGQFLVVAIAIHSIASLYFAQRLFRKFLGASLTAAMFGGAVFTFSVHMVHALGQPAFYFVATMLPWICCSALENAQEFSIRRSILGAVPVVIAFVGGYIPLGIATVATGALTVFAFALYTGRLRARGVGGYALRFAQLSAPFSIGSLVCVPYVLSLYLFYREVRIGEAPTITEAAYSLPENPAGLLRALSDNWNVPSPSYEFSIVAGTTCLMIAAIFVFSWHSIKALERLELGALMLCGAIWFFCVLAVFGVYSPVSALVYYFVPQVGSMHIYQRFLLFGHLAFATMAMLMLTGIVRTRPSLTIRIVFAVVALMLFGTAYVSAYRPDLFSKYGFNSDIVIELFGAALVAAMLMVPWRTAVFIVATFFAVQPALNQLYLWTHNGSTFANQKEVQPVLLKPEVRAALAIYIKAHSDPHKAVIKYADITPLWHGGVGQTFPKMLPYLMLNDVRMSSYSGYAFYLAQLADYRKRMPVLDEVALVPDWDYLRQSGVDFVVARNSDLVAGGALSNFLGDAAMQDTYPLPNDTVLIPASAPYPGKEVLFDNGVIRLSKVEEAGPALENLALKGKASASSEISPASRAIDGNSDGDFARGSVSHTAANPNSWLDVDLGESRHIGSIRVWNRTDCCAERLNRFWLFASEAPFGEGDTAESLRQRPAIWAKQAFAPREKSTLDLGDVSARYVRIQLPGDAPAGTGFLHIAEIEIFPPHAAPPGSSSATGAATVNSFSTNYANATKAEITLAQPVTLEYLFANNPRLSFKIDGKDKTVVTASGLPTLLLPAGKHSLEITYSHPLLFAFWVIYGLFWLSVIGLWIWVWVEGASNFFNRTKSPPSVPAHPEAA